MMLQTHHSKQSLSVHRNETDTLPSIRLSPPIPPPRRYNVLVKGYLGHWDWKLGHVTTHLDFQDWALQNDVAEFCIYTSRPATSEECQPERLVDLF